MKTDLTVPNTFRQTALAFPDKVKAAIARITSADDAAGELAKANAVSEFAKRIKATTEEINHVEYGKLLLAAKVGELCPAASAQERGTKGGRGKKAVGRQPIAFDPGTLVDYRKLAKYQEAAKLDEYWAAVAKIEHTTEMSMAGFLRYVSDGNLKANQNKGVIEWYTPEEYIEAARKAMGSIDLDPASSDIANKIVKAKTHHTAEDDGLGYVWHGNVFLNPPFKASLIAPFVAKLCEHVATNEVQQAVLLTNNNTDTKWWHQAAVVCDVICFTRGRVEFYNDKGDEASPTNGHTFFYFGNRRKAFAKCFAQFGALLRTES